MYAYAHTQLDEETIKLTGFHPEINYMPLSVDLMG